MADGWGSRRVGELYSASLDSTLDDWMNVAQMRSRVEGADKDDQLTFRFQGILPR